MSEGRTPRSSLWRRQVDMYRRFTNLCDELENLGIVPSRFFFTVLSKYIFILLIPTQIS